MIHFKREKRTERVERGRERWRERQRERIPSRLHRTSAELKVGLELTNCEVMT